MPFIVCRCGRVMLHESAPTADAWPQCHKCAIEPPDSVGIGLPWDALFWLVVACLIASLLSGCASQTGLYNPATERVCSDRICWIRADAELVNRRCTDRKSAWQVCRNDPTRKICERQTAYWDSGEKQGDDPGKRARCCTVLRPKPDRAGMRYWVWMSRGEEECAAHEVGHIEVYEQDGQKYIPESHKRLHGYGLGREKKRL